MSNFGIIFVSLVNNMEKINDGLTRTQRYRLKNIEKYREKKRNYAKTPEEKEKRRLYMQKWREQNREKHNQQAKESHHRNKYKHIEKNKDYHLKRKYGISLLKKQEMILNQNNRCLICTEIFKNSRTTHLDHCHKTGKIRGVLCHVCNTKLAWFEKNSGNVLKYLNNIK